MDWIQNINRALEFIEQNLNSNLTSEKIASVACSSEFHFMRAFSMLTGRSIGEYIKERRLTKAGRDIITTNKKIIDVALSYGYETPESFSKAFKRFHGIVPSKARKEGKTLKVAPPLQLQVTLKGDEPMHYKIEKKESFKITGIYKEISLTKAPQELPEFMKELWDNNSITELDKVSGPLGIMGVSYAHQHNEDKYKYLVGVEYNSKNKNMYNEIINIPSSNWSIFTGEGKFPEAITIAWKRIFEEWFPATGYEHAGIPEIEFSCPTKNPGEIKWEIWIPIIKK